MFTDKEIALMIKTLKGAIRCNETMINVYKNIDNRKVYLDDNTTSIINKEIENYINEIDTYTNILTLLERIVQ